MRLLRLVGAVVLGLPLASAHAGTAQVGGVDVDALLRRNGCLGCHGLSWKIVGPGYRDVASRYKARSDAVAVLVASIKGGSQGKWGQAPMPGFPSLTEAQLTALAEFVLRQ